MKYEDNHMINRLVKKADKDVKLILHIKNKIPKIEFFYIFLILKFLGLLVLSDHFEPIKTGKDLSSIFRKTTSFYLLQSFTFETYQIMSIFLFLVIIMIYVYIKCFHDKINSTENSVIQGWI